MGRRRGRATWRGREVLRFGPYFRRYSATANRDGVRGGFTSHGIRVRIPWLGPVTYNITTRAWTWDSPGPGSVTWRGSRG